MRSSTCSQVVKAMPLSAVQLSDTCRSGMEAGQQLRFAVAITGGGGGGGRPVLGSLLPSPACSQFIHHSAHKVNDL